MALLELRHVEPDHRVLVVEQVGGEGLGELGFPDAGGAEEDERADGPVRVLEPGAGAANGVAEGDDRLLLADDALVEVRPPSSGASRSRSLRGARRGCPVIWPTRAAMSSTVTRISMLCSLAHSARSVGVLLLELEDLLLDAGGGLVVLLLDGGLGLEGQFVEPVLRARGRCRAAPGSR